MIHQRYRSYRPLELTETEFELFESLTRRRFLIGAGALAVGAITGCGSQEEAAVPTATNVSTGYPRVVSDFFGPVEIKTKPQRILTYSSFDLDALLALDVKPALIAMREGRQLRPWQQAAQHLPKLVYADQLNIETLVAEHVDLILMTGNQAVYGGAKEHLGTRLPIITLPEGDFEGQLRIVGELLGLEQQATARIAEITKLTTEYTPPRMPKTIKTFGTYGDGTFYMFKPAAGLSKMLERFGMPPLSAPTTIGDQDGDIEAVHSISLELVQELEADLLIGTNYDDESFNTIAQSPLFQQLAVAREGRFEAFNDDDSTAIAYGSVLTIAIARDLLTRALQP